MIAKDKTKKPMRKPMRKHFKKSSEAARRILRIRKLDKDWISKSSDAALPRRKLDKDWTSRITTALLWITIGIGITGITILLWILWIEIETEQMIEILLPLILYTVPPLILYTVHRIHRIHRIGSGIAVISEGMIKHLKTMSLWILWMIGFWVIVWLEIETEQILEIILLCMATVLVSIFIMRISEGMIIIREKIKERIVPSVKRFFLPILRILKKYW